MLLKGVLKSTSHRKEEVDEKGDKKCHGREGV